MSLTGLKLSQINGAQEPLKDTDLFYYVTQSPGPIFDSKKGDVKLIREYVDATVGQTLRDEFILADSVVKTHAETIVAQEEASRVAADNVLTSAVATVQANVSAESTARINADAQLTTDLATEVQNRQTAITQEASSRTALQNTINASLALKADLVSGKIPASQLPSYVDDVIEVILYTDLPSEGEAGKIYVVKNTNLTYRWTGTDYTEISKSLAIGETDSTAYRGDRGKIAYDHTLVIAGNPHGTTKAHVGLGNADNTSDLSKPVSTATQAALDLKVNKSDTYVKTVNTQSGDVVLTKASISLGNVDNTSDLNKPISTATQAALDLKVTIPAPIQHTTAGDYSNTTSRRALRLTDATDRPITIDLATVPKNSGIVLTLTDISTNITDKLTTKTVKQLLVFKDTAGVVTEAAGTAGVSIAGQVVSIVYKGIAAKVIKTLITVNVEVLSEDNAVA